MRKNSRSTLANWIVALAIASLPALAAAQDQPRGDMFIGYSYTRARLGPGGDRFNLQGIQWTGDHNLKTWLAITEKVEDLWGSALVPSCSGGSCVVFGPKNTAARGAWQNDFRLATGPVIYFYRRK